MTWIRLECDAADDEVFDRLGEALGLSTGEAFYHYFSLVGKLAKMDTSGQLVGLLDRTIEQWAKWRGTPGGFAGVFRGLFADPSTGELKGFRRRNQKLLQKQAFDRKKRKQVPASPPITHNPQETPEGSSGEHPKNPLANVNVDRTTTEPPPLPPLRGADAPPAVAIEPTGPASGNGTGTRVTLHRKAGKPPSTSRSLPAVLDGLTAFLAEVSQETQHEFEREQLRDVMVDLTFAYWAKRTRHDTAKLDRKRYLTIRKRLTEGDDNVHQVLFAVDGALKDDNLMGRKADSTRKYDGVSTIYRDWEQVERLATLGGYREGVKHAMATKYLEGATVAQGAG